MTPSCILPKALQPGDTIAFVSLSARLNDAFPDALTRASSLFQAQGYKTRVFFTSRDPDAAIQTGIADRLRELRAALTDPAVGAVICTIGGETFTELLPDLVTDAELQSHVRAQPKIVLGTADPRDDEATPLSFCVKSLLDAITKPEPLGKIPRSSVYAPGHPAFFQDPASVQIQKVAPSPAWEWLRPGKSQGRLFGGLLGAVVRLYGVPAITPSWRGRIVFLETAASEADDLGAVRTAFADLIAQGVFDGAAGLVVGRPYGYDSDEARREYAGVITSLLCDARHGPLAENKFPILFNVNIGHTTPMVTLPFDALAVLDSESDTFEVLEAGVLNV